MEIPLIRACDGSQVASAQVDGFDYEKLSRFTWRLHATGYAHRAVKQVTVWMHREVLGISGRTDVEGDHINRTRLDNRRSNLRVVSCAENSQNRSLHRNNSSGVRGVSWVPRTQKWLARVRSGGRLLWSAYYPNLEDASKAVINARRRLLPFSVEVGATEC